MQFLLVLAICGAEVPQIPVPINVEDGAAGPGVAIVGDGQIVTIPTPEALPTPPPIPAGEVSTLEGPQYPPAGVYPPPAVSHGMSPLTGPVLAPQTAFAAPAIYVPRPACDSCPPPSDGCPPGCPCPPMVLSRCDLCCYYGLLPYCGLCSCCDPCTAKRFQAKYCGTPGDMYPESPYSPVNHGNYYFRPYHYSHIAQQQAIAAQWGANPSAPYQSTLFEHLYREIGIGPVSGYEDDEEPEIPAHNKKPSDHFQAINDR